MNIPLKRVLRLGVLTSILLATLSPAFAALCVWRNPDQDIKEFFNADSYRQGTERVGNKRAIIEKRIGAKLDPDEHELRFWPVYKSGRLMGVITTHLGRGDYGAVEVVMALKFTRDKVWLENIKIQRDRERYRRELRSEAFLKQFIGKTSSDPLQVGKDIRPAHPDAVRASQVVALSVKKLLVAFEELKWDELRQQLG